MDIPFPLISDIAQGRCLPFIGAGFSKNAALPPGASMPDWAELTVMLAEHAGTPAGTSPPSVAQRYEQRFGRVQLIEAIRDALHPADARPGKAHRAFARLPFDTIYTTNFDLLLEDGYAALVRPFRSLVGELQMPFHAGQLASSIIKMHGDLRHEEHITITEQDYAAFMDRYPVVATHLSAMLITRTPLFIGYSLSDPDFNNIRNVVRSRLGQFERMAYVIQFDVEPSRTEDALAQKIHIISLSRTEAPTVDDLLATFFDTIQRQLDARSAISLRKSRPDVFENMEGERVTAAVSRPFDSSVVEAASHLCFVMMPFSERFDGVYRLLIEPAVRQSGLSVLRADEIAAPGFIMEQIRAAIQQSRLCVADVTAANPNVLYELGMAQALKKPLVLVAESGSNVPFDIAYQRILFYGEDLAAMQSRLRDAIAGALGEDRLQEAQRLFRAGHYRATVAAAAVVLEQRLRSMLGTRAAPGPERLSLGKMLEHLKRRPAIRGEMREQLAKVIQIRNRAVHEPQEPTKAEAEFVVTAVKRFLASVDDEP